MTLSALRIPPGLYRSGTQYQSKGRWYDANLIRFLEGRIEPVGGWLQADGVTLDGPGRGMHSWRADNGGSYAGIGTVDKLWAYDGDGAYDITPAGFPTGNVSQAVTGGYGSGGYGDDNYGSSGIGGRSEATSWSLDNFGEYMVACASHDGKIYEWTLSSASPAALVTNAPICHSVFVTAERFVVALGAGTNSRNIAWSDQEHNNVWAADPLNQAGEIPLQTEGIPIRGLRTRGQSLILTTADAHTMRYIGPPYIYNFERAGENCGLIAANAAVSLSGGAAWMGYETFWLFDGVSVKAIPSEVADTVFGGLNPEELPLIWAETRSAFGEVTWHYPSIGSSFCDKYVTWNYRENHWTLGGIGRTAGIDAGVFVYPLATDNGGVLYEHEQGWTDDGSPRGDLVYLESGPIEMADGDAVLAVTQLVPDEVTPGAFQIRLSTKFTPEGVVYNAGPYTLLPYTDVRVTGRQLGIKIEGVRDEDSRIGLFRIDAVPGGRR